MRNAARRRELGKLGLEGGRARRSAERMRLFFPALLLGLIYPLLQAPAAAQVADNRAIPRQSYYLAFEPFANGDYRTATKAFQAASRDAIRDVNGRWADSICYHAMAGECFYQLGALNEALSQFDTALSLYLANSQWMRQVEFPDGIDASSRSTAVPWGTSTRRPIVGEIPDRFPCMIGDIRPEGAVLQGGVVDPAQVLSVRAGEIVRCTALALARRREILGPVCPYTRLTNQIVNALALRPGPTNHWSQAWISAQYGLALAGAGRIAEAEAELSAGVLAGGRFDHLLTPLSLLELGKLAAQTGKHEAAAELFVEASLAGAVFDQLHLVEESLRRACDIHLAAGNAAPIAALAPAAAWADRQGVRPLRASLRLLASEDAATRGQTEAAAAFLDEAAGLIGRREMSAGAIGSRLAHQSACVQFQRGAASQGQSALATFLPSAIRSSARLFQIAAVGKMTTAGEMSPRVANELYKSLLADPQASDWLLAPRETLAIASAPLEEAFDQWLETALARKDIGQAVEIAEQSRRRRFLASLPIGGRVVALRWLLEAPVELLTENARLQRQEMLLRHPGYAALAKRSEALESDLLSLPISPVEEADQKRQAEATTELQKVSATKEILLLDIALRRESADVLFPPPLNLDELRKAMPQDRLILMFHCARNRLTLFAISRDDLSWRRLAPPAKAAETIARLLKDLGNYDRNSQLSQRHLDDASWKKSSAELALLVFKDAPTRWWTEYSELVLAPDGPMWHAPFECLPLGDGKDARPLASWLATRYTPLLALAAPDGRGVAMAPRTVVVSGKLFPRADTLPPHEAAAEFAGAAGEASPPPANLTAPVSIAAVSADALVYLAEAEDSSGASVWETPLGGARLADWMALPWKGPQTLVLPAFRTPAEAALKRGAEGDEMFLALCGLLSSGVRTVLFSRWRTGGQSSLDLAREFVRELPFQGAAQAWRRSVLLVQKGELDVEGEPRLDLPADALIPKGEHPFFWAGYMLVDSGAEPKK